MYQRRLKILLGITIALFLILTGRLFFVQIIEGGKYSGISNKRRIRVRTIDASRGAIYDRNGNTLAIDRQCFNLSVKYKHLLYGYLACTGETLPRLKTIPAHKDTPTPSAKGGRGDACEGCHDNEGAWVRELSLLLEKPRSFLLSNAREVIDKVEKIKRSVEQKHKRSVRIQEETLLYPVAPNVDFEKAVIVEVNQKAFPGVSVEIRPLRWYPNHDLASHVIGYVGSRMFKTADVISNPEVVDIIQDVNLKRTADEGEEDDESPDKRTIMDETAGINGIEKVYDALLCGIPGERFEEVILENLKVSKLILNKQPKPGYNIFLTIDSEIQKLAEDALERRRGSIVVMDPRNGEVLALASYPRFDLNTFRDNYLELINNPWKPFLNRPIQSTLPPGSVFKVVTSLAALSQGKITPESTYNCTGRLKASLKKFRCYSRYGHGMTNLEDAIQYSCNTYFVKAGKSAKGHALWTWADKLGFGKKTDIDLPYERSGNLPKLRSDFATMNASLGQGSLLVTPLQVTIMMSAIANGGHVVKPHLIKKITDINGRTVFEKTSRTIKRLNLPPQYQSPIKSGLRKVVTSGTARKGGLQDLPVAGKTGTSETSKEDVNHVWFVGYAPLERPRYCFAVSVEHAAKHASDVAVPIAKRLLDPLLKK